MEVSKERGQAIAFLQTQKQNLELERNRIMDDLKNVKRGEFV